MLHVTDDTPRAPVRPDAFVPEALLTDLHIVGAVARRAARRLQHGGGLLPPWTVKEYVDRGVSGAKDRRPALDALVLNAKRRRFDVLVCWRLDRLGRNLRHLVTLIEELQTLGIVFVSLGEGIDCTTPAGKLQLHSGFPGRVRARQDSRARHGWPPASQDSRQVVEQTTEGADDDRHSWRQRADRSTNLGRVEVNGRALDRDGPIALGIIPFHQVTTFAVFRSVLCPQSRSNPGGTIICFRDTCEVTTMVVMAAKWRGRCRLCGAALPAGTQIEWTKETGARHVSAEACAEALANPPVEPVLRGLQPETDADRERIRSLLLGHPWKVAKTMPTIPHEYMLRRLWANDEDFIWCVEYIRAVGYEQKFGGRVFVYYDIGEHQYFPCDGDPRGPVDAKTTVSLINRALKKASLVHPREGGGRVKDRRC